MTRDSYGASLAPCGEANSYIPIVAGLAYQNALVQFLIDGVVERNCRFQGRHCNGSYSCYKVIYTPVKL